MSTSSSCTTGKTTALGVKLLTGSDALVEMGVTALENMSEMVLLVKARRVVEEVAAKPSWVRARISEGLSETSTLVVSSRRV